MDFKCDELILGKKDADSRALTNMLRAETSRKASLRKKQQFAGMSSPYLEKVLDAGLAELASI